MGVYILYGTQWYRDHVHVYFCLQGSGDFRRYLYSNQIDWDFSFS